MVSGAVAVRLLPFGDRALLAELDTLADVLTLHARLAATRPPGAIDLVPAARTVLVRVDPALLSLSAARTWVGAAAAADADVPGSAVDAAGDAPAPPLPVVELPVVYDGHDLAATAEPHQPSAIRSPPMPQQKSTTWPASAKRAAL